MARQFILLLCVAGINACTHIPYRKPVDIGKLTGTVELVNASKNNYLTALNSKDRSVAIKLSLVSYAYAEHCLKLDRKAASCLYYRALATGLYYQHHIIGFGQGLRNMRQDLLNVVALDPTFASGGAYRVLGVLYARAPTFGNANKSVVQDLELSKSYLEKAINLGQDYALNYLFYAKTLVELDDVVAAKIALMQYEKLAPSQDVDQDYPQTKSDVQKLRSKLKNN